MLSRCLSVGVIGCGDVAVLYYLPFLQRSCHVAISAVCDLNKERADLVADAFSVPNVYTDYKDMLNDGTVEAVVNLTPSSLHFKINLDVLRSGRHLYSEKLMADTVEDATVLVNEAARRGVKLTSAPSVMLDPVNIAVKKLVKQGVIGKVSYAVTHCSHAGPASRGYFENYQRLLESTGLAALRGISTDPVWFYKQGS